MERKLKILATFGFIALIALHFNNCDVYSDQGVFDTEENVSKSCLDDSGISCFSEDDDLLEIRINTENDLRVADQANTMFNVSGDCNEGNYPINRITWVSYSGGVLDTDNSTTLGLDGTCKNGRFSLLVQLPNGLGGIEKKIEVEISAIDDDGIIHKNPFESLGRSSIFIQPLN